MPKERRTRSLSFEARSRASPFPCSSSSRGSSSSSSSSSRNPRESHVASPKDTKEWGEVRCSVCMEYPHNAVLLTCSSGDKGCQPFMCDTSYRHSNCLDQYKKVFSGSSPPEKNVDDQEQSKLPMISCPLCRGEVTGWTVVEAARQYMNSKVRNCTTESCGFTGSYGELRKHARKDHPSVRPSEADPERQRDWRRMEQRRDLADLFSSMQSAMSGDDGGFEAFVEDDEELGSRSSNIVRFSSMAFLIIFRFGSTGAVGRRSTSARSSIGSSSRVSSRSQRGSGGSLWGETYNEPLPDDMDTSSDDDVGEDEIEGADDVADGGNAGGSNEVAAASRRGPGRPRRQLRMLDDESEDDDSHSS